MRIVFMGTPAAAVPTLERILRDGHDVVAVYTQPDRPAGRGNKISASPVKQAAIEAGLPVFQPLKLKDEGEIDVFVSHNADAAVVVAYGRILPEAYLTAFPKGAINVHFSLLPKYRGAAPVNWAIVNGESITGVTTMQMDTGLDTGAILLQSETAIGDDETATELMSRLAISGAELLSRTLSELDEIEPRAQDDSHATHAPIMNRSDGLIDWSMSAEEIRNRVRGFQPFPSAYTYLDGRQIKLWRTAVAESSYETFAAGDVIRCGGGELFVQCGGTSVLSILELQPEGKRRMNSHDFLNGAEIRTGMVLG